MSVVFGIDRGQVLVPRFLQLPLLLLLFDVAATRGTVRVRCDVAPAAAVVGCCRRKPKTRKYRLLVNTWYVH